MWYANNEPVTWGWSGLIRSLDSFLIGVRFPAAPRSWLLKSKGLFARRILLGVFHQKP